MDNPSSLITQVSRDEEANKAAREKGKFALTLRATRHGCFAHMSKVDVAATLIYSVSLLQCITMYHCYSVSQCITVTVYNCYSVLNNLIVKLHLDTVRLHRSMGINTFGNISRMTIAHWPNDYTYSSIMHAYIPVD